MRNIGRLVLLAAIGCTVSSSSWAAAPWQKILPFKRVEADADKSYPLTQENGPWMIMAMTFRGEKAETQARDLVHELRKYHKLPAYTHKKVYDYGGTIIGRGRNPDGSPKTMKHAQSGHIEEVAVLVGDYSAVDDRDAQRVLNQIKFAKPETLALERGNGDSQAFGTLRRLQQRVMSADDEDKNKGPMRHAFVTTNPLIPKEYFAPTGVDKWVLDLNKDVEHSLLKCKGKYTVKIATFRGKTVLEQAQIEKLECGEPLRDKNGREIESPLHVAFVNANRLAKALRAKGIEAYEFHDRCESIVTVGGFASVGEPRPDGKTEINPEVHAIMKKFGGEHSAEAMKLQNGTPTAGLQAKTVTVPKDGKLASKRISLDIQPLPVEVPRRSFSKDYQQVNYEE